jgi:hypothetical protein
MNLRTACVSAIFAAIAISAEAGAPDVSPLPEARPGGEAPAAGAPDSADLAAVVPQRRPVLPGAETPAISEKPRDTALAQGLAISPVPVPRPKVVFRAAPQPEPERVVVARAGVIAAPPPPPAERPRGLLAAIFRAPDKPAKYPTKGSVCGDPAIRGHAIPPIPAKLRGCGLENGVRVTAVDGVALTTPVSMNCATATALRGWVSTAAKPVFADAGGGLAALKVAGGYSCRTRNHRPGAPISEHGRGKAIDISGFVLKNGQLMTVLSGWRDRVQGPLLKKVHAAACGRFGTVLGPNSDRAHQDHFHFDTASHRGGAYCR